MTGSDDSGPEKGYEMQIDGEPFAYKRDGVTHVEPPLDDELVTVNGYVPVEELEQLADAFESGTYGTHQKGIGYKQGRMDSAQELRELINEYGDTDE